MAKAYGKKVWLIPDGFLHSVSLNDQVSHEAVCVLNTSDKDATVTFYPSKGGKAFMQVYALGGPTWEVAPHRGPNVKAEYDEKRGCYTVSGVTGKLVVLWQEKENIGDYKKLEFLR